MQPDFGQSNLISATLGRMFGAMWDMFAPVLIPLLVFAAIAFAAWLIRQFTDVG